MGEFVVAGEAIKANKARVQSPERQGGQSPRHGLERQFHDEGGTGVAGVVG